MPRITVPQAIGLSVKIEVVRRVYFDPEMGINMAYYSTASNLRDAKSSLDLESREVSSTANMQKTSSEVTPSQTMRGHTKSVQGVVPLPEGQHIITCSFDGSLRLWDLESGAQIGNDWRDERDERDEGVTITGVMSIALSPGGEMVATGSQDGTMRLWDIKTGKVITRAKHLEHVGSICWSPDGEELVSGSRDGRAGLWMVKRGYDPKWHTGHNSVYAVSYSPDATMLATSGYDKKDGIKIWDTDPEHYLTRHPLKLLATIEYDQMVWSLAWTLDGKKLISGGNGSIRIFDTDTWQQIAILEGHESVVHAISLFPSDRLLVSASWDYTARIWDLDRNLQVGPSLNHEHFVNCAAFSADGKLLVTGCDDTNAYVWDVYAILKKAVFENLLLKKPAPKDKLKQSVYAPSHDASSTERTSRSSLDDKSFLQADATGQLGDAYELTPGFFDGTRDDDHHDSAGTRGAHPHPSTFLARLFLLLHRSQPNNDDAKFQQPSQPSLLNRLSSLFRSPPNTDETTELPEPPTPSRLHPRALLCRLSSLFRSPPNTRDEATEPDQSSMHARLRLRVLIGRLSSFLRSQPNADIATQPEQPPMLSDSLPDTFLGRLSSLFRPPPDTDETIELRQWPRPTVSSHQYSPHVVEVSAMRDKEALYVARRPETASEQARRIKNPKPWVRVVLFLCCVSPGTDDGQPSP